MVGIVSIGVRNIASFWAGLSLSILLYIFTLFSPLLFSEKKICSMLTEMNNFCEILGMVHNGHVVFL